MFHDERVVSDANSMTIEAPSRRPRIMSWILLVALLAVSGVAIAVAMRNTSTTFDEIVFIAGGARGFETGDWSIAPEHPPLVQYLYGLPVYLAGPGYPDESNVQPEVMAAVPASDPQRPVRHTGRLAASMAGRSAPWRYTRCLYARDLGPSRNRELIEQHPDRTPWLYALADAYGEPQLMPYAEGMMLLWGPDE